MSNLPAIRQSTMVILPPSVVWFKPGRRIGLLAQVSYYNEKYYRCMHNLQAVIDSVEDNGFLDRESDYPVAERSRPGHK